MAYTSEDFNETLKAWSDEGPGAMSDLELFRIPVALRIASAVMRPGMIETAIHEADMDEMTNEDIAAVLRAALTDVKP